MSKMTKKARMAKNGKGQKQQTKMARKDKLVN